MESGKWLFELVLHDAIVLALYYVYGLVYKKKRGLTPLLLFFLYYYIDSNLVLHSVYLNH